MTPAAEKAGFMEIARAQISWPPIVWFGALLSICYGPVLAGLVRQWDADPDMSHGFFVPAVSAWIAWRKRGQLLAAPAQPNGWGLLVAGWGALQLYVATLGAELFLARTAFVISIFGVVLALGGTRYVRILAFPLFLLFFMVPIPAILYNRITFPLQILASRAAEFTLMALHVPVLREGNVLQLPGQQLSVVEACSGIRSLLSLSFLALVYGYFFEARRWFRALLLAATIPIAILANASRVSLTGLLAEIRPELAEGFFHNASGWVIFMTALLIMIAFHQALVRAHGFLHARGT